LDSSDFTSKKFTNLQFNYQFNTVDNPLYPRKGIQINAGARYTQNIDENEQNFVQLYSEAAFYTSKGRFTLASRTGIATNTGDKYEFYQANSLGGLTNLRGFRRDRYAGKTSVYQNTELRVSMGNMNAYVVKGGWGLLAFTDHGKVWMPNEESDIWHYGYGGGLWLLPFNKMAMTATYGVSKEGKLISVSAGFLF
jgi:outer membrane translocation and assembly module TamA